MAAQQVLSSDEEEPRLVVCEGRVVGGSKGSSAPRAASTSGVLHLSPLALQSLSADCKSTKVFTGKVVMVPRTRAVADGSGEGADGRSSVS